jgi:NAD(P)-dependent dehydrogenase (short-subunit alcohol dehydrogenase family)
MLAAVARVEGELRAAGGEVLGMATDVTDEAQVARLFERAVDHRGRVDLLVNCAGVFGNGRPVDEVEAAEWDRVIAVNLRGPFLCTRAAVRLMKRQGGGRIINVASVAAKRVRPGSAAYAASKAGVWGLTQVTALEGREHGIVCGCLFPGNTLTPGLPERGRREPVMAVEELAAAAVFMASQPPGVDVLDATVIPTTMRYLGRG